MKTRRTLSWLSGVAGGLLLAVPALVWPANVWGPGGVPGALERCEAELEACLEEPCAIFPGDGWPEEPPANALSGGEPLSYAGPGEISEGYPPEGTFIDLNTNLMWEMKRAADEPLCDFEEQGDRDVRCLQNQYTWTGDAVPHL